MVAAFYVVACVVGVWLAASHAAGLRAGAITLMMALCITTGGLVIMAPYFGYVFWFLEPLNIIRRIRQEAVRTSPRTVRGSTDADAC